MKLIGECCLCSHIGDWPLHTFNFCTRFQEITRATMTRGPQTIILPSAKWLKSGEGNNLVLCHFADDSRSGVSYYVGAVTQFIACCNQFGANHRLVAIMSMKEIQPVTVNYGREGRRLTLPNLWQIKPHGRREVYMAPVWEITQKVMLCEFSTKNYYCTYE